MLDAAYVSIDQRHPPPDDVITEFFSGHGYFGGGDLIMLSRAALTVTEVIELSGVSDIDLDDSDYELRPSGQVLRRLRTGAPHPSRYWRGRLDVTSLARSDKALRDSIALQLVKLDLNAQHGLQAQVIGTWREVYDRQAG